MKLLGDGKRTFSQCQARVGEWLVKKRLSPSRVTMDESCPRCAPTLTRLEARFRRGCAEGMRAYIVPLVLVDGLLRVGDADLLLFPSLALYAVDARVVQALLETALARTN